LLRLRKNLGSATAYVPIFDFLSNSSEKENTFPSIHIHKGYNYTTRCQKQWLRINVWPIMKYKMCIPIYSNYYAYTNIWVIIGLNRKVENLWFVVHLCLIWIMVCIISHVASLRYLSNIVLLEFLWSPMLLRFLDYWIYKYVRTTS
jgi:hypothetical protein